VEQAYNQQFERKYKKYELISYLRSSITFKKFINNDASAISF